MKTALVNLGAHQPPWANFNGPDCAQTFTIPLKPFVQSDAAEYPAWEALKNDTSPGNYLSAWNHLSPLGYELSTSLSRASGCFNPKVEQPDAAKVSGRFKAHYSIEFDLVYVRKMESKDGVNNPGAGMIIVHDVVTGGSGWMDMVSNAAYPWMPTSLRVGLDINEFTRAMSCIDGSSGACTMLHSLFAKDPVNRIPHDTQINHLIPLTSPTPLVQSLWDMTAGDGFLNRASLHVMNLQSYYASQQSPQTEPYPLMKFGPGAPGDLRPTSRIDYLQLKSGTPLGPLDQAAYMMLEGYFPEAALHVHDYFDSIPAGVCHLYELKAVEDTMAMVLERSGAAGHTLLGEVWRRRETDIGTKFPISQDHPFLQKLELPVGPLNVAEFFLHVGERLYTDCPKEPLSIDLALRSYREAARLQHPYAANRAHELLRDPGEIGAYGVILNEIERLLYDPSSFEFLQGGVYFPEGTDPIANLIQLHQIYRQLDLESVKPYEMYFFSGLVRKAFLEMRRDVNYLSDQRLRQEFRGDQSVNDVVFTHGKAVQFHIGEWFAELGDYFRKLQTQNIDNKEQVPDTRAEEYAVLNYEYAVTLGHEPTRALLRDYALMTGDVDAAVWAGQTDFYRISLGPIMGMILGLALVAGLKRIRNKAYLSAFVMAAAFGLCLEAQDSFALRADLGFDPYRVGSDSNLQSLINDRTVLKDGRDFTELFELAKKNPDDDDVYLFAARQALVQLTRRFGEDRYEAQKFRDRQEVYVGKGLNLIVSHLGGGVRAQHRAARVLEAVSKEVNHHFQEYKRHFSQDDERANRRRYNRILGSLYLIGLESPEGQGFDKRNFITALLQQLGTKNYMREFDEAGQQFFETVREIKGYYADGKHPPKPGMNTDAMIDIAQEVLKQDIRIIKDGKRK